MIGDGPSKRGNDAAFPSVFDANGCLTIRPGLTVREYFAGQALASIQLHQCPSVGSVEATAKICVIYADAVMEALKK